MSYYVYDGQVSSGVILSDDSMYIYSGGTANENTVNSGGRLYVSSGGTANGNTVNSGGYLHVSSGGTANANTVNSSGYLYIVSGGTANAITLNERGLLIVSPGGFADEIVLNSGGMAYISHGTATIAYNPWQQGGLVSSISQASVTYLERDANIYYGRSGGFIAKWDTLSGGVVDGGCSALIYSGGVANSTTVNGGGYLYVYNGGKITGTLTIEAGAVVSAYAGSIIAFDVSTIAPGEAARVNDLSLVQGNPDFTITVSATQAEGAYSLAGGAAAFDKTITVSTGAGTELGTLSVGGELATGGYTYSLGRNADILTLTVGSTVIDGLVLTDSSFTVDSGYTANRTTVNSGGYLYVSNGGTANETTVNSGGSMRVYSGGVADLILVSGGSLTVVSGGTALNLANTPWARGMVYVSSGATVTYAFPWSGVYFVSGSEALSSVMSVQNETLSGYDNHLYVMSEGAARSVSICSGGGLYVYDGLATDITVSPGGYFGVWGGSCSGIVIDGGRAWVAEEGYINDVTINDFYLEVSSGGLAENVLNIAGGLDVYTGGTATIVYNPWDRHYEYGGGTYIYLERDKACYYGGPSALVSRGDRFDGLTVEAGRSALIYSGGTANAAIVSGVRANMYVFSGGVANETELNYGVCGMHVSNGGAANSTIVSRGSMYVYSGGTASETTVKAGVMYVSNDGVANETTVSGGYLRIVSGGSASSVALVDSGRVVVSRGGYVDGAVVSNSGIFGLTVLDQGVADNAILRDGRLTVSSGGTAANVVLSGGELYLGSGGTATYVYGEWQLGADIAFEPGATLTDLEPCHYGNAEAGMLSRGAAFDGLTVESGYSARIMSGGAAENTTVSKGGQLWAFGGGAVSQTTVLALGTLMFNKGGSATDITVSSGGILNMTVGSCSAVGVSASEGARFRVRVNDNTYLQGTRAGSAFEIRDGVVSGFTLECNDQLLVNTVANSITVCSGGSMYVSSGGKVTGTLNIESGAVVSAYEGSTLDFDISALAPGAEARVNDLSLVQGTPDFTLTVSATQADGAYSLAGGAAAFDKTITVGTGAGTELGTLSVGGELISGDHIYSLDRDSDVLTLTVGSTVIDGLVLTDSSFTVGSGFTANRTAVNSGGYLYVSSGGVVNSTTVNDGGRMYVSSGGETNATIVNTGGYMAVLSGGVANETTISSCGGMNVFSGGSASGVTVHAGGILNGFSWNEYLHLDVVENGSATIADNVIIIGSNMYVSSGGMANETTVADFCRFYVYSGGAANETVVDFDGTMRVSSGGVANKTVVSRGGRLYVHSGGAITETTVESIPGGNYTGIVGLYGGVADKTTLFALGFMHVFTGGTANSTVANKGGGLTISSGGVANDSIANSGGFMRVCSGGMANETTVNSGGSMYVSSGGKVTGTLNIVSGAVVSAYDGSIIDFDVSTVAPGDAALVNDLSLVEGAPDFTLTVSATQAEGLYSLAGGAAGFDKTITVNTDAGTELGTLSVGGELAAGGYTYTLGLDDSLLTLTVATAAPVVKPTRGDFNGNGISDILFQNLTDPMNPLGAWMDADMWQWNGALGPAAKSDWIVYGAFDFTGDGVCDIMFRSKLAATEYAVGFYDMGEGGTFKTMGWGVTAEWNLAQVGDFNGNGIADILWSNTNTGYHGLWLDGTDQWVALPYSYLTPGVQKVFGVGDVNNDGCDEILINSDGNLGAWDIAGVIAGTEAAPVWTGFGLSLTSDWSTLGAADFDGNGTADIVLWNKDSGYVGAYMNCNPAQWAGIFPNASPDEWGIPGFGDYDGDGCDDVLVRNLATGALGYWSGGETFAWKGIGWGVDSTWAVIA